MTGCGGVGVTIASFKYSEPTTLATWVASNAIIHMYLVDADMALGALLAACFIIREPACTLVRCMLLGSAAALLQLIWPETDMTAALDSRSKALLLSACAACFSRDEYTA